MGPLGPSLLFAWQQERLIWLRMGLLFFLWDDMHDTVWAHTHACVRMNPSHRVEVASTTTLHEPRCVGALWFLRHVAHQSCAFWVFNIYMFGPHAKWWWLPSRTHLSGYQRYRCFPSVVPFGPSQLFAWQQESLIWLRWGLLFLLRDDVHDTVWAHTHACVRMNPSHRVEVASTTTHHEPIPLCVES